MNPVGMKLLLDIGATNLRMAVAHLDSPEAIRTIPTPPDAGTAIGLIKNAADEMRKGESIERIFAGIAGTFDREKAVLVSSPHLTGWVGQPLKRMFEKTFSVPAALENDAALAGLGEATRGAGRGYPIVAYVGIGTGVGGARIVNGTIDAHRIGFEPGHHIIEAQTGMTLEEAVSGSAIERRFGMKAADITNPAVWNEVVEWIAVGIHNALTFWSPDIVVLGGPGHQLVNHDRLGPKFVAAMDDRHRPRDVGQIERFLDRGIAAADHQHILVLVEKAVTGCARRNAAAGKRGLAG